MNARGRQGLALLLAVAAVAVLAVYAYLARDSSLERLRDAGVMRVGYAVEAPYAFLRPDGQVAGESPEIAAAIAPALGIPRIEWRQMDFAALIPELEAGRIDVIAAGMFITEERSRRVRFSRPSLLVHPGLLVPRGNPRGLASYRQVATTPDLRVAVLSGSIEARFMQDQMTPAARLLPVPDALTGRRAVEAGLADVLLLSEPALRWMLRGDARRLTEIRIAPERDAAAGVGLGQVAFAFRPEEQALLDAWNTALGRYLGGAAHRALLARLGLDVRVAPAPGGARPGGA